MYVSKYQVFKSVKIVRNLMLYGYQRILVLKLTSVFTYAVYITLCSLTLIMQQILLMQCTLLYVV